MNRLDAILVVAILSATLLIAGCTQAAPPPAPTQAPAAPVAAPTKAAEPTKPVAATAAAAPTVAPTAVPAKKVNYPEPGRTINYIVVFPAGGGNDVAARLLAPLLEKELGTSIAIANKVGANGQVGTTELVQAKPDGYTLGTLDMASIILNYLEPDRKTVFNRKSFQPIRMYNYFQGMWGVDPSSPFKSVKDVVDAAKAKPNGVSLGDTGVLGVWHLLNTQAAKLMGVSFNTVHFNGDADSQTALAGGHVQVVTFSSAVGARLAKQGQVRILGVTDKQRSKFLPDVPTFAEQGYNLQMITHGAVGGPAGIPMEIVDILGAALDKALASEQLRSKIGEQFVEMHSKVGPEQVEAIWAEQEATYKELRGLALATSK